MRRRGLSGALGLLAASAAFAGSGGCSAVLDFDDECRVAADCEALGTGLTCEAGFCVVKELIEVNSCARDNDCSGFGDGLACDQGVCVDASTREPATGLCDRIVGADPRTAEPGSVITLGALLPRSGALGAFGEGMEHGVALAVGEINQSGGVLGKLGVVSCDSGTDPVKATRGARHLVDVAGAEAIIGAGASGITIEVFNSVAKAARTLMISPSATSPAISNLPDDGLLWRTVPSDAVQGRAIAAYLLAKGYTKVGIINRNDAYGNGLAAAIQAELCNSGSFDCGPETLVNRTYAESEGEAQLQEQVSALTALATFRPDAVVLIAFVPDGVRVLNLAQGSGFSFILTDGMRDTALVGTSDTQDGVTDPAILCGIVGTFPASPSGDLFDAFAFSYEGQFGGAPPTYSANAYDATYLIALAYAAAQGAGLSEPDGRALAEGLARLSSGTAIALGVAGFGTALSELQANGDSTVNVSGVGGPLDFDAALGEAPSGVEMWRLEPEGQRISNLGVVFDGDSEYNFDAVLEMQPATGCVP